MASSSNSADSNHCLLRAIYSYDICSHSYLVLPDRDERLSQDTICTLISVTAVEAPTLFIRMTVQFNTSHVSLKFLTYQLKGLTAIINSIINRVD